MVCPFSPSPPSSCSILQAFGRKVEGGTSPPVPSCPEPPQEKEDGEKSGLEAMLQKVLQLYDSKVLYPNGVMQRKCILIAGDEILKADEFLETIIEAPEEEWNKLLLNGLSIGKGKTPPQELFAVIKKRIERTLIRTEGGSYQQRVLSEYLNGIQSRAEQIVQVLEGKTQ